MTNAFIVLRKEHDSYRSFGPLSHALSLDDARAEAASLAARYPLQEFRIFADLGGAVRHEIIAVELQAPSVESCPETGVTQIRRRARTA
jgi:hypothetical protein